MDKILFMKSILFLFIVILYSCNTDVDDVKPELRLTDFSIQPKTEEICGSLENNVFNVISGDLLYLTATFSDNEALSQYKIDIHNNFDCHGHSGSAFPSVVVPITNTKTIDWSYLEVFDIEGTEAVKRIELKVPQNVTAGNYHFSFQLIDKAGNDAENNIIYSIRALNEKDTVSPILEIIEPENSSFKVKKGETIIFKGSITDNYSLSEGGNGIVFLSYINQSSGNAFSTDSYTLFNQDVDKQANLDLKFVVPQVLSSGRYNFVLLAFDGVRNVSKQKVFEVIVE